MNPEAQEIFDRLVNTSPSQLTPEERAFLRARRDYLTDDQRRIYEEVLEEQPVDDSDATPQEEVTPQEETTTEEQPETQEEPKRRRK